MVKEISLGISSGCEMGDKDRDCVRVIVDGLGEIGTITTEDTEEL